MKRFSSEVENHQQKAKKMAGESIPVWTRWEDDEFATQVLVAESVLIDDFLTAAIAKMKLDRPNSQIVIYEQESVDRSKDLSSIIKDNSYHNPIVLFLRKPPTTKIFEPTIIASAPSAAMKKDELKDSWKERPIHSHWFSMEVYKSMYKLEKTQLECESISVTLHGQNFTIQKRSLDELIKQLKAIFSLRGSRKPLEGGFGVNEELLKEVTHTSLLSRSLDRFLFTDHDAGACLHQLPCYAVGKSIQCPDLFVVSLESGHPAHPILLSDFKLDSSFEALNETIFYAIKTANMYKCKRAVLALSGNMSGSLKLLLCEESGEKYINIVVLLESDDLSGQLDKFFCILYSCVHYVINNPIVSTFKCENESASHKLLSDNVVKCSLGKIHKYFDNKEIGKRHNYNIIRDHCLLPDAELITLSEDKRFYRLDYTYLKPVSKIVRKEIKNFIPLLRQLARLHDAGIVHGDVRCRNIIYTENGAKLIDFDLAGPEGSKYPPINHVNERHETAQSGCPRLKIHDRYSLAKCMLIENIFDSKTVQDQLTSSEMPLCDIANGIVGN